MFGSVGGAVHDLTAADTVLRSSLPLSRRIAVVAVDGGAGTTAVATALNGLLAHRRSGPVLGVDAAGGQHGLVARSGIDPSPATGDSPPGDPTGRAGAATLAQATAGLPRSTTGGYLLDLAGDQRRSASVADWARKVSPIARFFDLVITDWGVRPVTGDLPAAVQTSHVVVMVGRADRRSAATAASALAGLRESGLRAATRLVLVDVGRTADRVAAPLGRALEVGVPVLAYDPSWSAGPDSAGRRFGARTRRAHIDLAVMVMTEAVRSQQPLNRQAVPRSGAEVPVVAT